MEYTAIYTQLEQPDATKSSEKETIRQRKKRTRSKIYASQPDDGSAGGAVVGETLGIEAIRSAVTAEGHDPTRLLVSVDSLEGRDVIVGKSIAMFANGKPIVCVVRPPKLKFRRCTPMQDASG